MFRRSVLAAGVSALALAGCGDEKTYRNPSEAMEPTIATDAKFKVDESAYDSSDPERNDIVLLYAPAGADAGTCGVPLRRKQICRESTSEHSDTKYAKRVIGLPGDQLSTRHGQTVIDGRAVKEDFAQIVPQCEVCNLTRPITIPPDYYFVAGDNRGASSDSRYWGPVPRDFILGKVTDTG